MDYKPISELRRAIILLLKEIFKATEEIIRLVSQDQVNKDSTRAPIKKLCRCLLGIALERISSSRLHRNPATLSSGAQSALCRSLRYYTGASSSSRLPQQLSFREGSGAVEQMRSESARARSFGNSVSAQEARSMASAGLFREDDGRVRCAFCQGRLESGSPTDGESAMMAHTRQFPTCPFVLGMDVGNKADADADVEGAKMSTLCSEDSTNEASMEVPTEPKTEEEWRSLAMSDGHDLVRRGRRLSEPELQASISQLLLPPQETLRAVADPRAVQGLEMLERDASLLPIQHPSFIRQNGRLRTLENTELFEPADQVASAGFFLEASGMLRTLVCFSCDLRLPVIGFRSLRNAWIAHALWSPRCGHLLGSRGAAYVRRVRRLVEPEVVARFTEVAIPSQQRQQASIKLPFAPNLGIRYRVEAREFRARSDVPSAQMVNRLGFSSTEIRVAMELRLVSAGDDFATSELLLEYLLKQSEKMVELNFDVGLFGEDELKRLMLPNREFAGRTFSLFRCVICTETMTSSMVLGMTAGSATLLPCGHRPRICRNCIDKCSKCPQCSQVVRGHL